MLTTMDKIIILKTVSIFSQTADRYLAEVVPLLTEIRFKADERIFSRGDLGNCMYIIIEGKVRVHDGDMFLNYLSKRDVFGEMALLDPEPRLASVTTVEPTWLFRLSQQAFYDLVDRRGEIAHGVIRNLCRRLRLNVRAMADDFEYLRQFAKVTAAATAVEAGVYAPESLDEVALRADALGQLARTFQRMVQEIEAREARLRQQVSDLSIEIDQRKQARQVAEITESDYFQQLQAKVRNLRQRQERAEN